MSFATWVIPCHLVVAHVRLSTDAKSPMVNLGSCSLSSHSGTSLSESMVKCTMHMCDKCSMVVKLRTLNDLDLQHMQCNDRERLHRICGLEAMDGILSENLAAKLHLFDAKVELRTCHLRVL